MKDCINVQSLSVNLKKVREFARIFLSVNLIVDEGEQLVLAIDEACQNVIRHAYLDLPTGDIQICLQLYPSLLEVNIFDHGHLIDLAKIKPRALDNIKIGGLGTHFMNTIMDTVEFIKGEKPWINHLVMTKKIIARKKEV